MPTKSDLRRTMRDLLPPPDRAEISARICASIAAMPQWRDALTVAFFAPQPREPDIEGLWAYAAGKTIAYPRIEDEQLALHSVASLYDLQPARWDIREPRADSARIIAPESVDVILVPGVAFTRSGARCGRGGGYYDRLLATLPRAFRIGVCFPAQLVNELPMDAHDHGVNVVIGG